MERWGLPFRQELKIALPSLLITGAVLITVGGITILPGVAAPGISTGTNSKAPQAVPTIPVPIPTRPPGGRLVWHQVSSPNVGTGVNVLTSVDSISHNDAWASGFSDAVASGGNTLMLHWDGNTWSEVPSPTAGTGLNYIVGLRGFSADDVWAAGSYYQGADEYTLAEHWDGTAWQIVPTPNGSEHGGNALNGIDAVNAKDIWAVGAYNSGPYMDSTLIEHWDGQTWMRIASPNQAGFNALVQVVALTQNDAWAVGFNIAPGSSEQTPLLLHWDGQIWSIAPNPPQPNGATKVSFKGMQGANKKDVWMVGSYYSSNSYHSLTEHWNGLTWTYQVPSISGADEGINPAMGLSAYSELYSVAVGPQGEVWAAGAWSRQPRPTGEVASPQILHSTGLRTLLLEWNGHNWRKVTSETPGAAGEFLALDPHAAVPWAVGTYLNQEPAQTLIEQAHRR